MQKTITVKGTGKASIKPNYVVLSMNLESRDMDYGRAMEAAGNDIELLIGAVSREGFEAEELKTADFNVGTEYNSERRPDGEYRQVFAGYVVRHSLKLEFDFDTDRLGGVLSAIGSCSAHPRLSVSFTVRDREEINDELLRSAAENARRKAEVLCTASGKELGDLIGIDYSFGETNPLSRTRYEMADECLAMPMTAKNIAFTPENIEASDTASFVWEIK